MKSFPHLKSSLNFKGVFNFIMKLALRNAHFPVAVEEPFEIQQRVDASLIY